MKSSQNPYGVVPNSTKKSHPNLTPSKNNGLAIASLIFGILSFVLYFFSAIPGIITGHMALSRIKRSPEEFEGKGMAIAGLILSYLILLVSIVLIAVMTYFFINTPGFSEAFKEGFLQGLQQDIKPL